MGDKGLSRPVAVYLRKSRMEENEDTPTVLSRHRERLMEYADKNGLMVKGIYEEVASGDGLFSRPQMTKLLGDVERGEYGGVLCVDIDRLGRGNMQEQGLILNTLKTAGTVIITPEKIYDLNNDLDETQTEFRTFFARQELKMIKKRLSQGVQTTLQKGGYVSNPPFGYKRAHKDKLPTLEPNDEAPFVRMIFDEYAKGTGCGAICQTLGSLGVKPHRSAQWNKNSVRKILSNPVYIGKVVWGQKRCQHPVREGGKYRSEALPKEQWIVRDGLHPPIVGEELFAAAERLLQKRQHVPCRSDKIVNPLAGILCCRRCGRALIRRTFRKGGKSSDYLLCPTPGCMASTRAKLVEDAVVDQLQKEFHGIFFPALPGKEGDRSLLKSLNAALTKVKSQRDRLFDLLEEGIYSSETFARRQEELSTRIQFICEQIRSLQEYRTENTDNSETGNPFARYRDCDAAGRNRLLKCVLESAYYYKEKKSPPACFIVELVVKKQMEETETQY